MRTRWLGLAAIVLAVGAGAVTEVRPRHALAATPEAYVSARFDTGVTLEHLNADGSMPTLEQQGFRSLPVPPGLTADEYLAQLRRSPNILSAEKSIPVTAAAVPNDSYYLPPGPGPNQAQYMNLINAPAAWELSTGSRQVIVAVIDSGTDLGHPDLNGQLWENPVDNRSDGIDRDNNGYTNDRYGYRIINHTQSNAILCGYSSTYSSDVRDDYGTGATNIGSHGTLVAGALGAVGNNGQGVSGVAWDVRLMTVKVLNCQGDGEMANVAEGIAYAVRAGARVINVSIASKNTQDGDSPAMRAALQMAQNAGVIVVAAAGNSGSTSDPGTQYPAAYTEFPNLVAVGAANNMAGNTWQPYSSYGPAVDFAAPDQIVSTIRSDIGIENPYGAVGSPNGSATGGTSFATPLVSGMFALMISRNTRLPATDHIQIARETATPAPAAPHGQNWAGAGIINVGAAVARVPMTVEGAPLRDWRDVPPGTSVEAIVDGVSCGTTFSDAFGLVSRFTLRVRSAAEIPGCGQPGETVQIFVGGAPAVPTIQWGGQNEDLGLRNRDVSSVSPAPGSLVVQTLNGGWSNIAHLEPTGQLPGAVSGLPTPWTSIFKWDPVKATLGAAGAYLRFFRGLPGYVSDYPEARQYDAYWVDAPATNMASPNPNPPPGRTIELKAGWNNFTYTGQSRAVSDALESIGGKYSQVLQYDNVTGEWLSHVPELPRYQNDFGGLFVLKVYWVLMEEDGILIMD